MLMMRMALTTEVVFSTTSGNLRIWQFEILKIWVGVVGRSIPVCSSTMHARRSFLSIHRPICVHTLRHSRTAGPKAGLSSAAAKAPLFKTTSHSHSFSRVDIDFMGTGSSPSKYRGAPCTVLNLGMLSSSRLPALTPSPQTKNSGFLMLGKEQTDNFT